ncbi:hypothetical protein NBRC3280_1316 [Acetobacter pasteurianus NBRC 3280]|uniref:Tail fiber protein n=1 Tax=Acetobacter pasteurianus NBRC 3278 TaxID=1226660 RepID=A0A401X3F5_ACEPA|nr:hypothetical protein [Acetobacter pasteurianus]GCD58815.1 hypothetical protein NBRC3277_1390 [Acetobacter pasteurianus NBRC 3277]GCD62308.1 hypothetical protein NBRC3278_1401 [Acetobacter pasteurianus NBRC 3278]GCD68681.1 hypothetical protein NBRC3280_1316 [Acetobacter pasteurianus NBRC 3280]
MKYSELPPVITSLFAASAPSSAVTDIPDVQAAGGDGRVSWELGYPPETMIARSAGGVPPYGQDANGIGKKLSQYIQALQAGNIPKWTQDFANAIGGYPSGALAADPSTVGVFWVSTADDNTTQPGANGASWQSLFTGYVKKTGDTSTGTQYSTQFFSGGFGGGWNGARTNTGDYGWTNGLAFGNPANDGKYRGTWTVTDVLNEGSSNSSGLNLTGYDAAGTTYQWYFAWNGKVTTPGGVLAFESDLSGYVANTNPGISGALTGTSLCVNPSDGRSYLAYSGNTKIGSLAWYADVVSEATARTNADNNLQSQISSKQPAGAYIECPNGNKLIAFQIPSVKFVEGGTYVAFPNGGFSGMPVSIVSTTSADNDMDTMTFNWSKEGFYINIPNKTNSQNNPVSIMAVGPA